MQTRGVTMPREVSVPILPGYTCSPLKAGLRVVDLLNISKGEPYLGVDQIWFKS